MATDLFFDTARLGRMCKEALEAEHDFSKLASQLGSSLYWERFLVEGFDSLPSRLIPHSKGLSCWSGLAGLKQGLSDFVSLPHGGSVLFAGNSRTLVTFAAECLFEGCERVLVSDLEWPPYLAVLKAEARRRRKELLVLPVSKRVLSAACDRDELTGLLLDVYLTRNCDGLFLSDITHTGVRVPYELVLKRIANVRPPRFVVIDGAQAFGQRPVQLSTGNVDMYLAGTQKWFRAYHPLRLAFISTRAHWVATLFERRLMKRQVFDPLSEFCEKVARYDFSPFGETVNVSALITAAGALSSFNSSPKTLRRRWKLRLLNRQLVLDTVASLASSAVDDTLSSGISMLRVNTTSSLPHASLRHALAREHIVASEPLPGLVRLAMPGARLSGATLDRLRYAFSVLEHRR